MTTSLTRGLPRRLTWPSPWSSETRCPRTDALEAAPLATGLWRVTCNTGRYVEAHTPTTASEALASAGVLWSRVTSAFGTCRAIVWTL